MVDFFVLEENLRKIGTLTISINYVIIGM